MIAGLRKNVPMIGVLTIIFAVDWSFHVSAVLTAAFATVQLLREPVAIKEWLRDYRVASGPGYIVATNLTLWRCPGLQEPGVSGLWSLRLLALTAAGASVVAGLVLRPDNREVARLVCGLLRKPVPSRMAMYHGMLMLLSVILLAVVMGMVGCRFISLWFASLAAMETGRRLISRMGLGKAAWSIVRLALQ